MKIPKILVSNGTNFLTMGSGLNVVAIYPIQVGGAFTYTLLENGRLSKFRGSRINGVGVARYAANAGYTAADADNNHAQTLAEMLDALEGTKMVEDVMSTRAAQLQEQYAGATYRYVPFDPDMPPRLVQVRADCTSTSLGVSLSDAFSSRQIQIHHTEEAGYLDIALSNGWLVAPAVDTSSLPRLSDAVQVIEHAVFAICNSGLGQLVGAHHLVIDEDPMADPMFARGKLMVALENGDMLNVGGTADDRLSVQYVRAGAALHARQCYLTAPCLGPVIGDIAAVLVRVAEMDAAAPKKKRKNAP